MAMTLKTINQLAAFIFSTLFLGLTLIYRKCGNILTMIVLCSNCKNETSVGQA